MMKAMGFVPNSLGVAKVYKDVTDILIIDHEDRELKTEIETLGLKVHITDTIMKTHADKIKLAEEVLNQAD